MNDNGAVVDLLRFFQCGYEHRHIVSVYIPDVLKSKLVYKCTGQHGGGNSVLHGLRHITKMPSDARNASQSIANLFFQMLVALSFFDPV